MIELTDQDLKDLKLACESAMIGGGRYSVAASGTLTIRTDFANGAWTNANGKAVNFNAQFPLV